MRRAILPVILGALTFGAAQVGSAQQPDWRSVEATIGRPAVPQPGDVFRFNFPRSDLHVTAAGVAVKPALALGGWVAFKAAPGGAIAMGDLVLTDDEVMPVIAALQRAGIEQTAIHHHILHESPSIYYMHVHGHGDAVKLAEGIRDAVNVIKLPPPSGPAGAAAPAAELGIDTAQIAKALGFGGRVNGGVYQVGVPRSETIRDDGVEIPPSMGLSTAINFQPTGAGKAAITGDFVLLGPEVNPVIRALIQGGIEVTSLHSHLIAEEPRLLFMHFWANDDAVKLAKGLRAALDKTNSKKSAT
jgi:hypothetical protein